LKSLLVELHQINIYDHWFSEITLKLLKLCQTKTLIGGVL